MGWASRVSSLAAPFHNVNNARGNPTVMAGLSVLIPPNIHASVVTTF